MFPCSAFARKCLHTGDAGCHASCGFQVDASAASPWHSKTIYRCYLLWQWTPFKRGRPTQWYITGINGFRGLANQKVMPSNGAHPMPSAIQGILWC